jgi:DNA-binding FrmR family transcriptional regulator
MHQPDERVMTALKKAHTHLGKVIKMVEQDAYCIDIMQQNLAVLGLLRSAHQSLLENHLSHCFTEAMHADSLEKKQEMVGEILQVTKLANK